jgi:hypothetical protein
MDLGLQLTATGNVMPVHSIAAARESRHANPEASQITINTEARDVLRDLFPNIPDNDLNQIIKTAFQKVWRSNSGAKAAASLSFAEFESRANAKSVRLLNYL